MQLTDRDVAEFALLGLRFEVLPVEAVNLWAHSVIVDRDDPPVWVSELSTADTATAVALLNAVVGRPAVGFPLNLFLGLVQQLWCERQISLDNVVYIGWALHVEDLLPWGPSEKPTWGVTLYCAEEDFQHGWATKQEMIQLAHESLAPYKPFENLLPEWVR